MDLIAKSGSLSLDFGKKSRCSSSPFGFTAAARTSLSNVHFSSEMRFLRSAPFTFATCSSTFSVPSSRFCFRTGSPQVLGLFEYCLQLVTPRFGYEISCLLESYKSNHCSNFGKGGLLSMDLSYRKTSFGHFRFLIGLDLMMIPFQTSTYLKL